MPERWERELRRLGGLDVEEAPIRERVERGPSGDRMPPRRDRIVAGVVAAVVAIGAIAVLWRTLPSDGPEPLPPGPASGPGDVASDAVTIDIRRSSEESGDPEAIARFGSQEQWMCPDSWTLSNPDGSTDPPVIFDCGQEDLFEAPPGAPIEVTGDFATLNVSAAWTESGTVGPSTDQVAEAEPGTVVTYAYEVTWDDGSEASFWLIVTVAGETDLPATGKGIVVRLYGVGERSYAEPTATFSFGGDTGTACTQDYEWARADGTTMRDEMPDTSACAGRAIEVPPGTPIAIEAATTTRVVTTRATTPFFEGEVGLVISAEWPEGNATFIVPLTVGRSTPDLELVVLDCRPGEQVSFTGPDERILPGGSSYIVGNLPGFERTDVVEQMTRKSGGDTEWSGVWQAVRRGEVVASVDWDSLSGTACRGSGIGGV